MSRLALLISVPMVVTACGSNEVASQTPRTEVVIAPPTASVGATATAADPATATATAADPATVTVAATATGTADPAAAAASASASATEAAPVDPHRGNMFGGGTRGGGGSIGVGGQPGTTGHAAAAGTGQGFGTGHGTRLPGAPTVPPPRIRQGTTTVSGRLPPEVVQRIVRQNFGRFRLCYEDGLRRTPTLAGMVTTRFVIDAAGAVSKSERDASTTLGDAQVVACVVRAFTNLSFPQPEGGGVVTVSYPLVLEPGDAP